MAAAAKARSAALVAAAAAAAAEREAAEAMGETAGFVAAKWQETQQQLWGAAETMMGSLTNTPLAKGEVAPGRSGQDFADDWQAYREKYELAQVSSDTNPNDAMDALEELWNSRIKRSLEATAEEVKSNVLDRLKRDQDGYQEGQAAAKAQQQALRSMGLDASATNDELAAATEALRIEVEDLEDANRARGAAIDAAIGGWEAQEAVRVARAKAESEAAAAAAAEVARAAAPLAQGWREATSPDGRTYYYDADRKTTWERPLDEEYLRVMAGVARTAADRADDAGARARKDAARAAEKQKELAAQLVEAREAAVRCKEEARLAEPVMAAAREEWRAAQRQLESLEGEVNGGRFEEAEGGLLTADRAYRRATDQAEAADAELERLNAAVQEFLAEQAAGRESVAAIALKKAVRTQLAAGKAEAEAQAARIAASEALEKARLAAPSEAEQAGLATLWSDTQAAMQVEAKEAAAIDPEAGAAITRLDELWGIMKEGGEE